MSMNCIIAVTYLYDIYKQFDEIHAVFLDRVYNSTYVDTIFLDKRSRIRKLKNLFNNVQLIIHSIQILLK